ncbi:hypothetical protein C1646_688893 [Rhizophagus diaphanus]|nr:hypothetical protein C1646_688893 [Rhizophagus diaphanus] [Rhizophagus sp. MUCL 43196]
MYLHNGSIKIYEVPSFPHAATIGRITGLMNVWNNQDFEYGTDAKMTLSQNTERESDAYVLPIHRPRPQQGAPAADDLGNAYPTMIVEVGYAQSFPDLHRTASLYFDPQTTIQIVLCIKIFTVRADNTIALTASLYLRTSPTPLIPTRVISFGTADIDTNIVNYINSIGVLPGNLIGVGFTDPNNNNNNYPPCNAANIPTYLLNIPGPELFNGVPANLRPVGFAAGFNLDLWELQVVIRRKLNI